MCKHNFFSFLFRQSLIKGLFTLLFLLITFFSFSQKLTASANKTHVALGETFQINYTLDGNGNNFRAPALNEFDVYSGPNQSSSMSFVNGVMSQSISISYIIAAKREGKLTILPASISIGNSVIQSNSLIIEVSKGNSTSQSQASNKAQNLTNSNNSENVSDNLFVRTSVNKTKAFIGEQITITHKVYTRYQIRGFQDIKFSDYNGFWSQDMPMNNQQIQVSNENIDGINYQVAELKRSYLFPQRTGKLEISPMNVSVVVRKQTNKQPRDIFEQFFGGGYEDVALSVKSKPIVVDVSPLPESKKPNNFSGAVGNFSFKAQLNKDKIKANDAVNLTISITGKGNIKLLEPLKINFPEDFEVYDPKIKDNITVGSDGVAGNKSFDYLIIPRHEGNYKIDQINFSYFNTENNQYVTIPSSAFVIHVDKGDANSATASVFNSKSKEEVKILGNDIRFIKIKNVHLVKKDEYFFGSLYFYLSLILPFLVFLIFIFVGKKRIEQNKDVIAIKSRKATKMAKKRLVIAEKYLITNKKELFYEEIFKAIYGYISDKLNLPVSDLNKENIAEKLKIKLVNEQSVKELINLLNSCEFARYAPSSIAGDLKSVYNMTVELITKIENDIR